MPEPGSSLPAAIQRAGYERLAEWRRAPGDDIACPRCGAAGLAIVDRSARPFAEWYQLTCAACGLDHTFHVPVSRAGGDGG